MKAPSDEMAMRPLTEGTKRRTGLEKRLAWELERGLLSDPVPTLRKTRLRTYDVRRRFDSGYGDPRDACSLFLLSEADPSEKT